MRWAATRAEEGEVCGTNASRRCVDWLSPVTVGAGCIAASSPLCCDNIQGCLACQLLTGTHKRVCPAVPTNPLLPLLLAAADFGLSIDITQERPVTRVGTLDYMVSDTHTYTP